MVRYISSSNECSYIVKSAESQDVDAAARKAARESKSFLGVKRSAEEKEEPYKKSKKFRLVKRTEEEESYIHPPAVESPAEATEEDHVSLDDIMHEASLIGAAIAEKSAESPQYVLPPPAPVELAVRPRVAASPLPVAAPSAPSAAVHSPEQDEQDDYDEEHLAINFAMGLPVFDTRATDISKLLGAYDPLDDEYDDDEGRFGEPLEGFRSDFYKLGGLDANGEEISGTESVDSSGDDYYSDEDEFDSEEEDEYDESEYGDEEIDRAYFIGDDEENEEWEEHEHDDAELDAEEGVSVSGDERDDEETELEGEEERKASVLYN